MLIALSLLIISFLIMVGMIYLKRVELNTGRQFIFLNEKSDQFWQKTYVYFCHFFRHWNLRTFRLFYHFLLEKVENFFIRIYRYFRNKFSGHVNMVKGQGSLTEDKTSSSFFLKNIEEHKNGLNNK